MQQQSSIKYTVAASIWAIIVTLLLVLSGDAVDVQDDLLIPGLDKIAHVILFAILTFFVAKALKERQVQYKVWILFVLISLYGMSTELIQLYLEDRHGDIYDFAADVVGVVIALLILRR